MDRFKSYVIKPWNSTAIFNQDPIPRFVKEHLMMVYFTLGYALFCALFGAFSHLYIEIGGWITAVGFIGSVYWISRIDPWREHYRIAILIAASYFFGSTIGPAINLIFEVNQSLIIKIIMGGLVVCSCHFRAGIYSEDRRIMYEIGEFLTPIFITAWITIYDSYSALLAHLLFLAFLPFPWHLIISLLKFCRNTLQIWSNFPIHLPWIAFLCYCFNYSFDELVFVYALILALLSHMKILSQEAVYKAAHNADECYYVETTITFFTEFVARTMSLIIHNVSVLVDDISWCFLRRGVVDDHAHDHE